MECLENILAVWFTSTWKLLKLIQTPTFRSTAKFSVDKSLWNDYFLTWGGHFHIWITFYSLALVIFRLKYYSDLVWQFLNSLRKILQRMLLCPVIVVYWVLVWSVQTLLAYYLNFPLFAALSVSEPTNYCNYHRDTGKSKYFLIFLLTLDRLFLDLT